MTAEEISQIEEKIERLTSLKNELKNEEQAVKLTMNSIYGAIGNAWFICFNPDVAEAVTLQGQDLIKYSEKILHKYFHDHWHLDTELHEKLGLTKVKKVVKPLVVYGDTDSNYVTFQEVVDSCDFEGGDKELILLINKYRLNDYLKKCFDIYSKKWGTENYQDFELESLSYSGIFLGKKKYVLHIAWQDPNKDLFPRLSKIKSTGIELAQGGTAPFAREKLTFLLRHIFEQGKNFDIREFVKILKEIKNEFKVQSPDQISVGTSVNNLEKFIVNDTDKFEVAKGCPMHVRASGYHNYLLNKSKYKAKYSLIRSSEKIKYYYVKVKNEQENNVFGYLNGSYPYELAPPVDFDEQFNRVILDPINRFIEAMGYTPLSPNLLLVRALY